jgi:ADP-heptose:LPS heptosyltransferase
MFENVPFIVQPQEPQGDAVRLEDYTGHRPYIRYRECRPDHQALDPSFRATPGHIYFSDKEKAKAGAWVSNQGLTPGFVIVEPHVKEIFSGRNKAWPWNHWVELVKALKQHGSNVVQVSKPGSDVLPGVDAIATFEDVRVVLAVFMFAGCAVTTDGLFHHAAAALKVPAVVIWGSRTNPEILGYRKHENITSENPVWCGSMRQTCKHCTEAMKSIEPQRVWLAVDKMCRTPAV